ncbi:MAG: helix-turn-helix transcriptional regulator [Bacteroidales bacterium]|nr:helix-turn-helix transcriptional regulator [Bacteroidales bacterium]
MSLDNISIPFILYFMLYGASAMTALIACIYLLFRKSNAIAPDVAPPMPLRRWAAAFLGVTFVGHIYWLLFYLYSGDTKSVGCTIAAYLDCLTLFTTIPGTLFAMLQDRKRHVWPIVIATIPLGGLLTLHVVKPNATYFQFALAYFLLIYVIFTIYMVFAVKQYGRWLRDNYADLENKEIWISHVLVIVILLLIIFYGFDGDDLIISFIVQFLSIVFYCFLLWRVETLPQLENVAVEEQSEQPEEQPEEQPKEPISQPLAIPSDIEELLDERCVATQLYLQHDITLPQLAKILGTNRTYLSQYFSYQGITFNAYINNLRINHFIKLYHEAVSAGKTIIVQQLAKDSGFRSYSTFSLAFKQKMGQSVTTWMREM